MEVTIRKLFAACRIGENETFKSILEAEKAKDYSNSSVIFNYIFKYKSYEGYNLLMVLVHHRKRELVKYVLENFLNFQDFDATTDNEFTHHNGTVLHIATDPSSYAPDRIIVVDLLQAYSKMISNKNITTQNNYINLNLQNPTEPTTLSSYSITKPPSTRNWIEKEDSLGRSALMLAVSSRKPRIVDFLLGFGPEVSQQDKSKRSALHYLFDDPISSNFETKLSKKQTRILRAIFALRPELPAKNKWIQKSSFLGLENLLSTLDSNFPNFSNNGFMNANNTSASSKFSRMNFEELVGNAKIDEVKELLKQNPKNL